MSFEAQDLLNASGKVTEVIPAVYGDVAKPAMQQTGSFLARIPHAINAALAPIDRWIAKREYSVDETKKLLEVKLRNIDPDKIVPPEPYVAVPAIQAISYSMDSKELREMYANLLAKAMNVDEKENVHPSFVEIIKQLSPLDANVLKYLYELQAQPSITLLLEHKTNRGYIPIFRHITAIDFAVFSEVSKSLDNLSRCSLINIEIASFSDKSRYSIIRNSEQFIVLTTEWPKKMDDGEWNIKEQEEIIRTTDLGDSFYEICVK